MRRQVTAALVMAVAMATAVAAKQDVEPKCPMGQVVDTVRVSPDGTKEWTCKATPAVVAVAPVAPPVVRRVVLTPEQESALGAARAMKWSGVGMWAGGITLGILSYTTLAVNDGGC